MRRGEGAAAWWFGLLACWLVLIPVAASAAIPARDLGAQMTASFNIALIKERRLSDERNDQTIAQFERRIADQKLVIASLATRTAAADRARVSAEARLEDLRGEFTDYGLRIGRERGLEQAKTQAYLAEARREVKEASPAMREGLQRYADGDRTGAMPILDDLIRLEAEAAKRGLRARTGAEYRAQAGRYDNMRSRGEASAAQCLRAWERVVQEDPDGAVDWWRVGALRDLTGDRDGAIAAYEEMFRVGADQTEKLLALGLLLNMESMRRDNGFPTAREHEIGKRLEALSGVPLGPMEQETRTPLQKAEVARNVLRVLAGQNRPLAEDRGNPLWPIIAQLCAAEAQVLLEERKAPAAASKLGECRTLTNDVIRTSHPRGAFLNATWDLAEAEADLAEQTKQIKDEVAARKAARDAGLELAALDPTNRGQLHKLGWTTARYANALVRAGKRREAIPIFEESLEIFVADLVYDPDSVFGNGSLRDNQLPLQALYIELKDYRAARRNLDLTEMELASIVRLRPDAEAPLTIAFQTLTARRMELAVAEGDYPAARSQIAELSRQLTLSAPEAPRSRDDVSMASLDLTSAFMLEMEGRKDEAFKLYDRSFTTAATYITQKAPPGPKFAPNIDAERVAVIAAVRLAILKNDEDTWRWAIGWLERAEKGGLADPEGYAPEVKAALKLYRKP